MTSGEQFSAHLFEVFGDRSREFSEALRDTLFELWKRGKNSRRVDVGVGLAVEESTTATIVRDPARPCSHCFDTKYDHDFAGRLRFAPCPKCCVRCESCGDLGRNLDRRGEWVCECMGVEQAP